MDVRPHLRYLSYVARHKLFVFLAAREVGVGLWQALTHDCSKFRPSEWRPYVAYFYGPKAQKADGQYFHKPGTDDAFDYAWLLHQHRNPHHHQHFVLRRDDGTVDALPMPEKYVREMVADWIGAGRAQAKPGTWKPGEVCEWYERNKGKMILHPRTREQVEALLHD